MKSKKAVSYTAEVDFSNIFWWAGFRVGLFIGMIGIIIVLILK